MKDYPITLEGNREFLESILKTLERTAQKVESFNDLLNPINQAAIITCLNVLSSLLGVAEQRVKILDAFVMQYMDKTTGALPYSEEDEKKLIEYKAALLEAIDARNRVERARDDFKFLVSGSK